MTKKVEAPQGKPSANEIFKDESNFLRGTIEQSFKEPLSGKFQRWIHS